MAARKSVQEVGTGSRVRRRDYGRNHAYYLTRDDGSEVKLDGVTSLLSDGVPKPALMNWAGNVTAEKAVDNWASLSELSPSRRLDYLKKARFEDRDTAAAKGTLIHGLAERILHGEEVEIPDEVVGHVESAVLFMNQWQVEEIVTETTCYHVPGFYAGTLDLVFRSPLFPGRVFIGDWKTSRSGIYDEAAMQVSAYQRSEFYVGADGADHSTAELGITDAVGIWIRADGYTVYSLDTSERTFETFRYAATVARRLRAMKEEPLVGSVIDFREGVSVE